MDVCAALQKRLRGGAIMNVDALSSLAFQGEDHVLVLNVFGKARLFEPFWRPAFQKAQERAKPRIIAFADQVPVVLYESGMFLCRPLSCTSRDAENVRRLVPETVWLDAGGALHRSRY